MARKKTSMRGNSLFQNIQDLSAETGQTGGGGSATSYPLIEIMPDPDQPRLLLPDDLREALISGRLTPQEIVGLWLTRAEGIEETAVAARESLDKIIALADSISDYGLINAITIRSVPADMQVPLHIKHLVVTGERRWWAHVVLSARDRKIMGEGDPNFIRAESTDDASPIRILQWVENIQRDDINVIEKARGLDLIREELKVTTGKTNITWAEVEAVAQIGKSQRIRIRRALDLDPAAIDMISQHNLTERAIRPIVNRLKGKPKLQIAALKHLVELRSTPVDEEGNEPKGESVDQLIGRLLSDGEVGDKKGKVQAPRIVGLPQWHKKLAEAQNYLAKISSSDALDNLSDEFRQTMENDLTAMENRIAALRSRLKE